MEAVSQNNSFCLEVKIFLVQVEYCLKLPELLNIEGQLCM